MISSEAVVRRTIGEKARLATDLLEETERRLQQEAAGRQKRVLKKLKDALESGASFDLRNAIDLAEITTPNFNPPELQQAKNCTAAIDDLIHAIQSHNIDRLTKSISSSIALRPTAPAGDAVDRLRAGAVREQMQRAASAGRRAAPAAGAGYNIITGCPR